MAIWPPDRASLKRPAYRSLAQALVRAIEAGEIRPGDRLPTHRDLAFQLGLSVQTVGRAYEELTRLDIIAGEVGRGTFVRETRVDTRQPWHRLRANDPVIDCSMLTPVTSDMHAERTAAAITDLAQDLPPDVLFSFRPRAALARHRQVGTDWLRRCGIDAHAEDVLPTNGVTSAMTVAMMTAVSPGELILTEFMGHHTLPSLTRYLGMRLGGLPVDAEGIDPDAFDHACRTMAVKALYVIPNGLNPLARLMGRERRERLCDIARIHDVLILENDAGGPLIPGRPPPLAALAPERVFYFTGFTKCLLPGLRFGYLVIPETYVSSAVNRHLVTNWMATALIAELATRWVADQTALELLAWQQSALRRRNQIAARALAGLPHDAVPNGMHVWLPLEGPWREEAFVAHARHHGVAVAAGSAFAIGDGPHPKGVRISLGAPDAADLAHGLDIIARLVRDQPEPAMLTL
ncbi:MAG: PLP-dependent aminotransferase family protein [Rhodobacteraceae bacterium]|nr:PLP-dependent aminotransferase family protein [Paracoccaceae bacterium]